MGLLNRAMGAMRQAPRGAMSEAPMGAPPMNAAPYRVGLGRPGAEPTPRESQLRQLLMQDPNITDEQAVAMMFDAWEQINPAVIQAFRQKLAGKGLLPNQSPIMGQVQAAGNV